MASGIGRWLTRREEWSGNKLALIYGERRLTYRELNRRVNRLANALNEMGVRQGDRVAGLLPNGNEILEIMFACAKLGAIFVPVNFRLTAEEVRYVLEDSASRSFFYHRSLAPVAEPLRETCPQILHRVCVGGEGPGEIEYESLLERASDAEPDRDVSLEQVHLMMYTSGTTGKPKGAMLTHANTTWNVVNTLGRLPVTDEEVTLTVAPLFHIGAMNILTTPVLYRGGTVVIHDRFDPVQVLETIEREKITSLFMVPSMWLALLQVPGVDRYDLRSLRLAVSGGAPCPIPVIERFQERGVPFFEGYGMTETSPSVCILEGTDALRKRGSVGKPLMHVDVRIVDDAGRDVPVGEVGELLVRGPTVTIGYWNRPAETREALRGGWLHTGDLARMDDEGFLYIVDRKKDMIISGGENVYPAEVEQVLYRHPKIREVAVVGAPDEKWGETVKAVVALKEGETITLEEIQRFCEGKLARYKVPRLLEIVDALPRNAAGKVLKTALRNR
ncbi:MAG: o-succinylbenzoate--CoA ligase [Alicyclobacillaceae bacterium]|nr:o-succinylbenzoate--CoA ligase [Alicyclobacillaceae bacterium]